jgi:hypothetical protein
MTEPMKCGQCGKRRVTLRASRAQGSDAFSEIRARCCHCKSVTIFALTQPRIVAVWGKNTKGILCVGWPK